MLYYDPYFNIWYIDPHHGEEQPKRKRVCDECKAYKRLGITACEGCSG